MAKSKAKAPKSAQPEPAQKDLTDKQERFCQLYTTHWNATRAAREAEYSAETAAQLGYQLLQIPSVQARIKELTVHSLAEIGVTRERVLLEYSRIAFLDLADAYHEKTGKLLPVHEMPEHVRRAIAKIETFEEFEGRGDDREYLGDTQKVEFSPKKPALDALGKHLGLDAPTKLEHTGKDGAPLFELSDAELDAQIAAILGTKEGKS